ncbi:hypothetical protein [Streptococcus parasanguinis]|jgi:hypothetical protein|uniref:Uncharacterized protein n=1 Tax=Streptococcus parasanguinis FW213 TaxID=1114965 RepID=I1ZK67_STRPA|nr:hypothetical protein [Streptococcus parasanguinis]AFJ25441.1 hypothetical protein Spaf_0427 [Streptococcus parasanguinis FW213]KJU99705.1 hypothetical protein UA01_00166 [Streptococcus parasanguinis]PKZ96802.1 hypothetical protein CYK20_05620 [Streptococcus parasanguinis]
METREEIVSKLELIRENILGFIQARSRQVTLVNQMRTAKLIQQDEYNDNTLSHKSLKLAFSIMVFSSISILLGDLLYVILLGAVNRLIGDIIFEVLFLSGFLFLLFRRMKGSKDSWIYPATLIMGGILLVFPLRLLLTPNPITLILLGVSIVATYFIIQNKLELMIAFVNKGIRNKNEQHLRDYQAVVAENQRLELAYQQEGRLMENFRNQAVAIGQGWYPKDYYALDAVNYLIHSFNNFKADNIKEAINLYDTYLDREARRAFEAEMIELEKEQIINQERMIKLQEHANILSARQIAETQEAAAASRAVASELENIRYGR